jgi:hypothetical protein
MFINALDFALKEPEISWAIPRTTCGIAFKLNDFVHVFQCHSITALGEFVGTF